MFSQPFISFFLLIALVVNLILASSLNIQQDTGALKSKLYSYGSVCDFDDSPSDDEFLNMVQQAYSDMTELYKDVKKIDQKPTAMIGLAIGNQVYFSSSVRSGKGKPIVYELAAHRGGNGNFNELSEMPDQYKRVTDALSACSKDGNSNSQHKSNGMCGEITSTMTWMIDHPDDDIANEKARVAAWWKNGYLDPCSGDEGTPVWGCSKWTKEMKYEVVDDNPDREPGFSDPSSTKQVSLDKCTVIAPKGKNNKGGKRDEEFS